MDFLTATPSHHLDAAREHLFLPKSPPRNAKNGLCKAVLPPSPTFQI